jgi:hypothetical protein
MPANAVAARSWFVPVLNVPEEIELLPLGLVAPAMAVFAPRAGRSGSKLWKLSSNVNPLSRTLSRERLSSLNQVSTPRASKKQMSLLEMRSPFHWKT